MRRIKWYWLANHTSPWNQHHTTLNHSNLFFFFFLRLPFFFVLFKVINTHHVGVCNLRLCVVWCVSISLLFFFFLFYSLATIQISLSHSHMYWFFYLNFSPHKEKCKDESNISISNEVQITLGILRSLVANLPINTQNQIL